MATSIPPTDPLNPLAAISPSQKRQPLTPTGGTGHLTSGLPDVVSGPGDSARDWAKDTAADIEHVEVLPTPRAAGGDPAVGLDPMAAQPGVRGVDKGGGEAVAEQDDVSPPGAYIPDSEADGGMRAPTKNEKRGSLMDAVKEYLPESVAGYLPGSKMTELPSKEQPSGSRIGVGSLPGNISEASVAKLPDERLQEGSIPDPDVVLAAENGTSAKGVSGMPSIGGSTPPAAATVADNQTSTGINSKTAVGAGVGVAGGIAAVGAGILASTQQTLSNAGQVVASYLPGTSAKQTTSTWTHEATSLPGTETPSISTVGVGSLPGNISEVSVAKLPEERRTEVLPSHDYDVDLGHGRDRVHKGGVGVLPGTPNEEGVGVLPEERVHPESEIYAASRKPHLANTTMSTPTVATSPTTASGTNAPPGATLASPTSGVTNASTAATLGHSPASGHEARNIGLGAGAGAGIAAAGAGATAKNGGGAKESLIQKVKHKVTSGLSSSEAAPTSTSSSAPNSSTAADQQMKTGGGAGAGIHPTEPRATGGNDDINEPTGRAINTATNPTTVGESEAIAEPGGGSVPGVGLIEKDEPAVGTTALNPPHSTDPTTGTGATAAGAGLGLGAAGAGGAAAATVPGTTGATTTAGDDTGKHDPDVPSSSHASSPNALGSGTAEDTSGTSQSERDSHRSTGSGGRHGHEGKVKLMDKIKGEAKVISGKIGRDERKIEEGRRLMRKE